MFITNHNQNNFTNLSQCKYYSGDITPAENTIFVFGSNTEGRHGAGAAKVALTKFQAIYAQPTGLQGNSYAIVTKNLTKKIHPSVSKNTIIDQMCIMLQHAIDNPQNSYKLAYRNKLNEKSLCGYTAQELMLMLEEALDKVGIPNNFYISEQWMINTGIFLEKNFSNALF